MPILFCLGLVALFFGFSEKTDARIFKLKKRIYDLDDIEPSEQGGNWSKELDLIFEDCADRHNVPFALLKAHAIMESSLNPMAFRDENPKKRVDRTGWASRGLMQILWWPKSERFKKYGYRDDMLDDGEALFDAHVNIDIGAQLIKENLVACKGQIRDAINMYNTGKKEAEFKAPYNYVDRVLTNYNTLIKRELQ